MRAQYDRRQTLTTAAKDSGNAMAVAYVERLCPAGHGELERREWSLMVQLVCKTCGFVRQLKRRDAPPRAEDVVATADHPTIGRAPKGRQ